MIAIQGYSSLRELLLPLGQLTVITGANGSGKSSVYRSLRLLPIPLRMRRSLLSPAKEAFPPPFWAGPETIAKSLRRGSWRSVRPLSAAELSDGTLRFLLWAADLLTPRPPQLMVLNEPETSLHPDLMPALARLILAASRQTQIVVVSHAQALIADLTAGSTGRRLHLEKSFGETTLEGATLFNAPKWVWPAR